MEVPVDKRQEAMALIQAIPIGWGRGPTWGNVPDDSQKITVVLSVIFEDGRSDPEIIKNDLSRDFSQRFPEGFEKIRADIDAHPELLYGTPREPAQ
jgi:hypothetical protein